MPCGRRKRTCSAASKNSQNKSSNQVGEEAVKAVLEFLNKVDMAKISEIADGTGLSGKVVRSVIEKLKKEGKIESPKRCYYSLKK